MKSDLSGFERFDIGGHTLWVGRLPDALMPGLNVFDELWNMHPPAFHEIKMFGRSVKTPRWQQAYGQDYHYSGRVNKALPIPPLLRLFLGWSQDNIATGLNGLLLNWYDGRRGHYIGPHRDSVANMIPEVPIVTISLGDERIFRLRPWPAKLKSEPVDFPAQNGTVFVMPYETNRAYTHEVPPSNRHLKRRISITVRGFLER
jgi:alkylated DNA repair dioxygenase AlkB